jgi:hypothetical protein
MPYAALTVEPESRARPPLPGEDGVPLPSAASTDADDDRFLCFDTTLEWFQWREESLTPEEHAAELNECSDYMGSAVSWKVEGGEVVRDSARLAYRARPLRPRPRFLPQLLAAVRRPRERRPAPRRRSSSAARRGASRSDPDLDPPGSAGLAGVAA